MVTFTAQVSSLFAIDLHAAVVAGVCMPDAAIHLFFSDAAEVPLDPTRRKFVARSALPLCEWTLDRNEVWRQLHVPLEGSGSEEFGRALRSVASSLAETLRPAYRCRWECAVQERCDVLTTTAIQRAEQRPNDEPQWARLASGLIEEIFTRVVGRPASVRPYGRYRVGAEQDRYTAGALRALYAAARAAHPRQLQSTEGGYLEVQLKPEDSTWLRSARFSAEGSTLVVHTPDGVPACRVAVNHDHPPVRFRGALEMLLLQEFGTLVDLPSYAEASIFRHRGVRVVGMEFISPMSARSLQRTARTMGGSGLRLTPSGYSLIDCDEELVRALIAGILGVDAVSSEQLADWRRVVNEYPASYQKISKHQGTARGVRHARELAAKAQIAKGAVEHLHDVLMRSAEQVSPLAFGDYLAQLLALLSLVKEWASPPCPLSSPPDALAFLAQLGWTDSGYLVPARLSQHVGNSAHVVLDWLEQRGFDRAKREAMEANLSQALNEVRARGRRLVSGPRHARVVDGGLGHSLRQLRLVADQYFSFAAFAAGSLLKSSILFNYLLLGADGYRKDIRRLVHARTADRWLYFEPRLWDTVERTTR